MKKGYYGGTFNGNPEAFIEVGKGKALDVDLDKLVSIDSSQINFANLDGIADDLKFSVDDTITNGQTVYLLDKDKEWHQISSTNRAKYKLSERDFKKLIQK